MTTIIKKRTSLLDKLTVSRRITLLILIPLIMLLITGVFVADALNKNRIALNQIEQNVITINKDNKMIHHLNRDYIRPLYQVQIGSKTWEDGLSEIQKLEAFTQEYIAYRNEETALSNAASWQALGKGNHLLLNISKAKELLKNQDRYKLELYLLNDLSADYEPFRNNLHEKVEGDIKVAEESVLIAQNNLKNFLTVSIILTVLGVILAIALGYFIYQSISASINKLSATMIKVSDGYLDARVGLVGKNELVTLGNHVDKMLDDRLAIQINIDDENYQLNESVFKLLQTVGDLSERDLTVRAEVTEDATGPVADALNLLAEETTETLVHVRDIAESVQKTSKSVNNRLVSINKLATQEQEDAEQTALQIDHMLNRLNEIANSAYETNKIAEKTSISTQKAHTSVMDTVNGMADIRETVQETGKRIKQLGERSQEISYVIEVINTIAERTTVLALNASMQAVAAGDAGRGFSVIADEIQRLAESSRDSTGQISTLVRNIQQETNTTIATMNKTVEQVVNGSTRAEDAAQQMKEVLATTSKLVQSVDIIASSSHEQVDISRDLKLKAASIIQSTQSTGKEIRFLTGLSRNMSDFSQKLVQSVSVFTLEDSSETVKNTDQKIAAKV